MGEGSRRQLSYIAEVTPGTSPASGYKLLRNNGGGGIVVGKQTLVSAEYRSDRAIPNIRHGNKAPVLDIPMELSYTSYDDLMEAALFGAFTLAYNLTALTVTVDASAKTFTCALATFITSGLKIGDKLVITGFADSANNGTHTVTNVTETVITCSGSTLTNVTDDTGVAITTARYYLKQGVTAKYLSIEEGFTDIAQYQVMAGALCNGMTLNVAPNAMVTGSFNFLGLAAGAFSGTSIDTSPDAAPTTQPFDSFTGSIKEGGSTIATITSLTLNLQNGLEHYFALFDSDPYKIGTGRANLTGSISAFFENATMAAKFLSETASSIEFTLTDLAGNSLIFLIPALKYTGATKSMTENNVIIDMPFQAYYDATQATALRIDRRPV